MKFFACSLLFTFVIFFNSVQSSLQPSGRNVQRRLRLVRRLYPERHFEELAIVDEVMGIEHPLTRQERLMLQEHRRIPDRLLQPQQLLPSQQARPRQQPAPSQQPRPRQQPRPHQQPRPRQQQTPSQETTPHQQPTQHQPTQCQQSRPGQQPTPFLQKTVQFNDGDFMYRGPFPIGKVKGGVIYEHPARNAQPKIVTPEAGDKLLHSGVCIGKYDNGWQPFHQQR